MAANIGPRIGIDGEAEYRKQIQNIIQSTKTLKSEMQALETQTTKSKNPFVQLGNEMTKNAEKRKLLSAAIDEQKAKIADLSTMQSAAAQKFGESSTQALKWQQALSDAEAELNNLNAELDKTPSKLETMGNAMQSAGAKVTSVGKTLMQTVTAPIVGIGVASMKAYSDFDSAFTGVMKTVDESAEGYKELSDWIMDASTRMASSKTEIAGVMEVAGQLGITGVNNLEKFTETMVMLGDTTNLSSEEAATNLARLMNITGDAPETVDRLGSAIVALGNNSATTEAEIVTMATRLASAGSNAGLTTTDILALATAMSSVGIEAEAGGTAMSQTLIGISKAVFDGGEKLQQLASISGMTAEQFATTWKTSPIEALQAFIGGLSQMNEAELDTYKVLDELDMSGIRQTNMLQSLARASGLLENAVTLSNAAYKENTALVTEADLRYQSFAAKMTQTKEKISNVGVELGEKLLPYVDRFLDGLDNVIAAWDNLSPGAQDAIVKVGLIAAAIGPLIVGIGTLMSSVGQIMIYGPLIAEVIGGVGAVITGTMLPALGSMAAAGLAAIAPFLPFIAIGAAIVAAGVLIYKNWDTIKEKAGELKEAVVGKFTEIKDNVSQKWDDIKNKASEALQGVRNSVDEHGGGIKGAIGAYADWYKSKWQDTFNAIDQVTGGKLSDAVSTVGNKLGEIRDKFTNLGSQAVTWGRDMIQNFINGIQQKISDLINACKNIGSTIKDYIGFSEPDKGPLSNFHTFAPDMMKLFTQGIEENLGMVEDAISNVSASVATGMEQKSYTSSVGAVNIVINAAEGQSVDEIADAVEERINRGVMLSARAMG